MSSINIVVCAEKTEYKVAVKNKIVNDELSIIGYADFQPESKMRIQGFVPDVVVFVLDSDEITPEFLTFVEDINLGSFGCSAIIMTDNVTVDLVNNAAQSGIRRVMNVNIGSVMNLCHLVIPSMVHRHHGRIINISSVWGNVGASCEAVYSASKGAINSFTKALAKELAPSNIQVNAIAFGAIETPMNAWLSKEEAEALADEIPAGREGTKEEAAQMICMVADAPDYLTGQIITMDGGWI